MALKNYLGLLYRSPLQDTYYGQDKGKGEVVETPPVFLNAQHHLSSTITRIHL